MSGLLDDPNSTRLRKLLFGAEQAEKQGDLVLGNVQTCLHHLSRSAALCDGRSCSCRVRSLSRRQTQPARFCLQGILQDVTCVFHACHQLSFCLWLQSLWLQLSLFLAASATDQDTQAHVHNLQLHCHKQQLGLHQRPDWLQNE